MNLYEDENLLKNLIFEMFEICCLSYQLISFVTILIIKFAIFIVTNYSKIFHCFGL